MRQQLIEASPLLVLTVLWTVVSAREWFERRRREWWQ